MPAFTSLTELHYLCSGWDFLPKNRYFLNWEDIETAFCEWIEQGNSSKKCLYRYVEEAGEPLTSLVQDFYEKRYSEHIRHLDKSVKGLLQIVASKFAVNPFILYFVLGEDGIRLPVLRSMDIIKDTRCFHPYNDITLPELLEQLSTYSETTIAERLDAFMSDERCKFRQFDQSLRLQRDPANPAAQTLPTGTFNYGDGESRADDYVEYTTISEVSVIRDQLFVLQRTPYDFDDHQNIIDLYLDGLAQSFTVPPRRTSGIIRGSSGKRTLRKLRSAFFPIYVETKRPATSRWVSFIARRSPNTLIIVDSTKRDQMWGSDYQAGEDIIADTFFFGKPYELEYISMYQAIGSVSGLDVICLLDISRRYTEDPYLTSGALEQLTTISAREVLGAVCKQLCNSSLPRSSVRQESGESQASTVSKVPELVPSEDIPGTRREHSGTAGFQGHRSCGDDSSKHSKRRRRKPSPSDPVLGLPLKKPRLSSLESETTILDLDFLGDSLLSSPSDSSVTPPPQEIKRTEQENDFEPPNQPAGSAAEAKVCAGRSRSQSPSVQNWIDVITQDQKRWNEISKSVSDIYERLKRDIRVDVHTQPGLRPPPSIDEIRRDLAAGRRRCQTSLEEFSDSLALMAALQPKSYTNQDEVDRARKEGVDQHGLG